MSYLIFLRIIMYIINKFFEYAILHFCVLIVQEGLTIFFIAWYRLKWINIVGQLKFLTSVIFRWRKRTAFPLADPYKKKPFKIHPIEIVIFLLVLTVRNVSSAQNKRWFLCWSLFNSSYFISIVSYIHHLWL